MGDEGTKRQLPQWMMGVTAADQGRKSEKEGKNVNFNNVEKGTERELVWPKSKPKTGIKRVKKGVSLAEEEPSEANAFALVKCGTKRQRKEINRAEDAGSDFDDCETAAEQKRGNIGGRKVRKCAPKNRRKVESSRSETSEEIEAPSPSKDDGELTVDDLMSIANEYIGTEKLMERKQSSHRKQEPEIRVPAISSSGNDSGGLLRTSQSNRRSLTQEERVSVHNSTGTSTRDPAQDMLDLFLGPLLKKKPPGEQHKIDFIKEHMTITYEIKRQKQGNIPEEEVVPLAKKKSSLKDKVAMLLD